MRLSYKILTAFLLTSLISVALTVGVIRYFAFKDFQSYLLSRELDRVGQLAPLLQKHFQANGGWQKMTSHPRHWHDLLRAAWDPAWTGVSGAGRFAPPRPVGAPPGGPLRPPRQAGPPDQGPPPPGGPMNAQTPGLGAGAVAGPVPSPPWDELRLVPRLALYDAQKNLLAGPRLNAAQASLVPVELNGRTIAWLGLNRGREFVHPLDAAFMERQTQAFYLIGLAILVLAAGVALVLSRLMTAPIRRLAAATRKLRERRFETRIEVRSRDELGHLAEDFNLMARELGRFQERQQQWLSDISHELRTPLSVLIGEIEAVQDGVRPADEKTMASLRAEAGHLSRIIDDLRQLSLAEAGGLSFERRPLDPLQTLGRTLERYRAALERAGFAIETDLDRAGQPLMEGDEGRLSQVFANLFKNVLNHAAGPGRVRLRASVGDGRVFISLEDSGPGPEGVEPERLFDRLYKADKSRHRAGSGSGLGLAIARAVVEAHGGAIQALPSRLGGLAVEISLPLKKAE